MLVVVIFAPLVVFINKIILPYMNPNPNSTENMLKNTQKLYGAKCASCHGANGEGMAGYPAINNPSSSQVILQKLLKHPNGALGQNTGLQMRADLSNLSTTELDSISQLVCSFGTKQPNP